MLRLKAAEFGKAAAGGGAWLGGGVVLVTAGILIGLLMSGLAAFPGSGPNNRIGLVPHVPVTPAGSHHRGGLQPAPPAAQFPRPPAAVPPPAPPPVVAAVFPRPAPPAPAHHQCLRRECKRPGPPLPAARPPLQSLYASVPSLSSLPAGGEKPWTPQAC